MDDINKAWETEPDEPVSEELAPTESKIDAFRKKHADEYADSTFGELKDHPRAWLVLVDSEDSDWGIIEDTNGNLLWVPGKGDIVGTWTRSRMDGRIHISLMTTINALEDKAVATWAKYAEERKQKAESKTAGKRTRKKKEVSLEDEAPSVENKMAFDKMRARLRKK